MIKQVNEQLYSAAFAIELTRKEEIQFATFKYNEEGEREAVLDGVDPQELLKVCMERLSMEEKPVKVDVDAIVELNEGLNSEVEDDFDEPEEFTDDESEEE